jgi:hypothetical protein
MLQQADESRLVMAGERRLPNKAAAGEGKHHHRCAERWQKNE